MIICLDPGHGGRDPGACAGVCERELTLLIARRAKEALLTQGHRVVWTRTDSRQGPPPSARPLVAARMRAGLLVSIHANACASPLARGVEAWYAAGSAGGMELARGLLQALAAEYGGPLTLRGAFPDTANRHRRLAVLRGCQRLKVASVLIECGFLTNAEDLAMMQSVEYGLALGRAIGRVADRNRIVVHSLTNK